MHEEERMNAETHLLETYERLTCLAYPARGKAARNRETAKQGGVGNPHIQFGGRRLLGVARRVIVVCREA